MLFRSSESSGAAVFSISGADELAPRFVSCPDAGMSADPDPASPAPDPGAVGGAVGLVLGGLGSLVSSGRDGVGVLTGTESVGPVGTSRGAELQSKTAKCIVRRRKASIVKHIKFMPVKGESYSLVIGRSRRFTIVLVRCFFFAGPPALDVPAALGAATGRFRVCPLFVLTTGGSTSCTWSSGSAEGQRTG